MKRHTHLVSAVMIIIGLVLAVPAFAGKDGGGTQAGKHEIIVSKDGDGDFTTIQEAFDSITDAADANRYVVKVKPGIYNEIVTMKPFVDLSGSGQNTTIVTGSAAGWQAAVIHGSSYSEIRSLSVEAIDTHYGIACEYCESWRLLNVTAAASVDTGSMQPIGIYTMDTNAVMTNVTATASTTQPGAMVTATTGIHISGSNHSVVMTNVTATSDGGNYSKGIFVGGALNANVIMNNVTVTSTGPYNNIRWGIENNLTNLTARNVTISAENGSSMDYGIYNRYGGITRIDHSTVAGSANAIMNQFNSGWSTPEVYVGQTQLGGGPVNNSGGVLKCVDVYNDSYDTITCP